MPAAGITGQPGGVPAPPLPPLPGRPPEALTPSGRIPLPAQREAPAPKSRIPKFSEDPLRAIAFVLSEAALAFGGQPTNLGRLMRLESEADARVEAQAFERQGLRLRTMAAQRDGVKFALDMLEKISPENRKQIIPRLTVTVPGIDQEAFAEELQSLADSEIASIKGTLDALTPEDQIALSAIPGFNDLSLRERSKFAQKMIDSRIEIATAVAKQSALAPERIAEAGATAAAIEAAKAEFREPKGKAVNLLLLDGRRATGRELPGGELKIVGEGGTLVPAPPGTLKMTLQAAPGELPDAALNR